MVKIKLVGRGLLWVLLLNMIVVYIWTITLTSQGQSASLPLQTALRGAIQQPRGISTDQIELDTFPELPNFTHMIVVAGHAVTVTESLQGVEKDDKVWYLLPYQYNQDLPEAFVAHIKAGVEAVANDPSSVLVFSGGQTREKAGPRSEAVSYFGVAEHFDWWGVGEEVRNRTIAEEYARDSFENLLFSLCRFKEFTRHYPSKVTIVSFGFKKERFESFHRAALRFPRANFHYVGVDPHGQQFDFEAAKAGEYENALKQFKSDPYGCHSPVLRQKRLDRNPFRRTMPYSGACPEMGGLLHHCARTIYGDPLPWDAH